MKIKQCVSAILLCLASISVAQADCTVYEHINYGGAQMSLAPNQNMPFVGQFWNDKISSVSVNNACRLVAYQHANYGGDRRVFSNDASFVGNLWNDQISALECKCNAAAQPISACTMYEHANFQGGQLRVSGSMSWVGDNWNDKVSAVKVPNNCHLTVYQHINFGGDSRDFSPGSNVSYIGDLWNDQISSAICSCN